MGRSLSASNGSDKVMTPLYLCREIVKHFKPTGSILEPCRGTGNFLKALPHETPFCEIDDGLDFFECHTSFDWIITNPPYSKYRAFLKHAMEVADNVVFLQLINATFYKARLRDVKDAGFGIKEILCVDTPPKPFPQFGFQLGCVHYKRNHEGDTKFSVLIERSA